MRIRLGIVALVLAGCGDDGSGESTSGPATTTETTSASSGSMSTTSGSGATTMAESTTTDASSTSGASEESSSSSGSGASDSGSASGGGMSFETDVWPLLEMERARPLSGDIASCLGCHGGSGAGGLATPDVDTAYTNLMDGTSSSKLCAGTEYVVPGDPDSSCFVLFYEMRLRDSLGWVDQAETDIVRAWVEGGAAP